MLPDTTETIPVLDARETVCATPVTNVSNHTIVGVAALPSIIQPTVLLELVPVIRHLLLVVVLIFCVDSVIPYDTLFHCVMVVQDTVYLLASVVPAIKNISVATCAGTQTVVTVIGVPSVNVVPESVPATTLSVVASVYVIAILFVPIKHAQRKVLLPDALENISVSEFHVMVVQDTVY